MQVIRGHREAPAWAGSVVAIGNFDGVHAGHRALIAEARRLAATRAATGADCKVVALTFDPHPAAITGKGAPVALCSLARRLELLAAAGVEATVIEPFTTGLAGLTADQFVDDILVGGLRARAVVVGYDFAYGAGRCGTLATLRAAGLRAGFEVAVVPPIEVGGEVVSSTRVREYLREGEVGAAARLLGRPFDVDGVVVHGAARGREIGIPTANVHPDTGTLPLAGGIYAVTIAIAGGPPRPAVASFGRNPTFVTAGPLVLEVHVLDFEGDLYDRHARVTVLAWQRAERAFDSVDALLVQIHQDIADARRLLAAPQA